MATEDSFPYEYGSDLHCLWGWGHRIESLLAKEGHIPSKFDWIVFRPSRDAADAMMRFGVDYPTVIQELKEYLSCAEEAFEQLQSNGSEHTEFVMVDRMDVLSRRIRVAAEIIAERENTTAGKSKHNGDLPNIVVNEKLSQARYDGNGSAGKAFGEPLSPHDQRQKDRDEWIYDQRIKGSTWRAIREELDSIRKSKRWNSLATNSGIRRAAERHARCNGLTLQKGKGGRPKSTG